MKLQEAHMCTLHSPGSPSTCSSEIDLIEERIQSVHRNRCIYFTHLMSQQSLDASDGRASRACICTRPVLPVGCAFTIKVRRHLSACVLPQASMPGSPQHRHSTRRAAVAWLQANCLSCHRCSALQRTHVAFAMVHLP